MSDTISRQAAIDAINKAFERVFAWDGTSPLGDKVLENVPSAQPGIIRCKDCKHRDPEDKKCDCGHDILWQLPRDDNWFCADAERRTNEA